MSSSTETKPHGPAATLAQIAEKLKGGDKFVVASHMNPDGDAIGSARAAELLLKSLDKDVIVFIPGAEVSAEYQFVAGDLTDQVPADISSRILLCVDCGNAERIKSPELLANAAAVYNIDHHGDNTRFGDLNHVRAEAACAAELVWELGEELGVTNPNADIATAVYVGLVTDTGRFQYSNTRPESFELAATLQRAGVDVHEVFGRIFESAPFARVKLLGRALERAIRSTDGRIIATHLSREDFTDCRANEDDAEGIVDALRSVEGTDVAVFLRDLDESSEHLRKGSLRTTREDIDVSAIARTWIGGGHRQAAGFNTADSLEDVVARVENAIQQQLATANK